MAVTWKINSVDYTVNGSKGTNQISTIHWSCSDTETIGSGEDAVYHSGNRYGAIACPDPSGSFITYADVTQANCITWVKALLGSDEVTAIETSIDAQITESKTPTRGTGTPW